MKRKLLSIVIPAMLLLGCEKEENIYVYNSLAEDLKQIIANENVEELVACPPGANCNGFTDEYSFPGDNFICFNTSDRRCFNLNNLYRTEIKTIVINQNEVIVMTLFFDPYY